MRDFDHEDTISTADHKRAVEEWPKTGPNTHRAIERGFAGSPDPHLIEPGEIVPPNIPISTRWMQPADEPWEPRD